MSRISGAFRPLSETWRTPIVTSMRQPTAGTVGGPPTGEQIGQIAGGLQGLVGQYNQAYQQARSANEARYQRTLQALSGGYERGRGDIAGGYESALGELSSMSGQQAADIRSSYGQQQAGMMQGLARSGMAGTTVAPAMQLGIQREQQSSLGRLADLFAQQRAGLHTGRGAALGGLETERARQMAGVMERRTDAYPQQEPLMAAIQGIGGGIGGGQGLGMMAQLLGQVGQGEVGRGVGTARLPSTRSWTRTGRA